VRNRSGLAVLLGGMSLSVPAISQQPAQPANKTIQPPNKIALGALAVPQPRLDFRPLSLSSWNENKNEQADAVPTGKRSPAQAGAFISRTGATGLIRVPSTFVTPEGDFQLAYVGTKNKDSRPGLGNSETFATTIGFLPHFEIGFTVGNEHARNDLTGNTKLQVLQETSNLPTITFGAVEVTKLGVGHTIYGAASKHFLNNRVNLTGGIMRRSDFGFRGFGGVEVGVIPNVSAVVEHDSHDFNFGLRGSFLRDHIIASVYHIDTGWNVIAGIKMPLTTRRSAPAVQTLPHPGAQLSGADAVTAIQRHLADLGLENISARIVGGSSELIEVGYENRSYAHNEMDALANVLATAAAYAPGTVKEISVIIKRSAIPILHVACPTDDYRRFMAGELDAKAFAGKVTVDNQVGQSSEAAIKVAADSGTAAKSFGHGDLFIRPAVNAQIGTEQFVVGAGLDIRPELDLPVARGIGINARATISGIGPLRSRKDELDRAVVNASAKLGGPFLARATAGRFPQQRDGLLAEALWNPDDGQLLGRLALGLLDHRNSAIHQQPTYVGEARYYLPAVDMTLRLTGGRYLEGDKGFTANITRRFGDTELGFEFRDTTISRVALLRLGVPLGPSHLGYKPSTLRVRPPDFIDYNQRVGVETVGAVANALATGNELAVGNDAERSLLDRDRLNRAYILRSLSILRHISPIS
jgi:hypothetical protein